MLAHPQPEPGHLGAQGGEGGQDQVGEIDGADRRRVDARRRLTARQQQQPGDQLVGAARRLAHDLGHPPQLRDIDVGVGQGDVDLRPQHGERRAQLVAGIGDEPALRVERGLQPVEHRVEPGGQLRDLPAGIAELQPRVERLGGEPTGGGGHGVERPEHAPDEPPRHDRGGDHDQRKRDQPGAQHLRAHRCLDRGADLLGGHLDVADPHPAARR